MDALSNFDLNFEDMDILELFSETDFDSLLVNLPGSSNLNVYLHEEKPELPENSEIPNSSESDQPKPKRFKTVTNEEMDRLFENRQAKTTKRNTAWGMKIFQDWNIEVFGTSLDMQVVDIPTLSSRLSRFYCEARPKGKREDDEPLYHKNTLINIRAAINRHLADVQRDVNIVKDKEFRTANGVLDGLFKERTQLGLSKPTKHKQIIEINDLQKIYKYLQGAYSTSPVVLRHAVWYFLAIHFVTRGLEFHHQLNLDSFAFITDETGEYATLKHETLQKNNQGGVEAHDTHTDKRMYASDGENSCCPVQLLKLLISKTDKNATSLFNQYIKDRVLDPNVWFSAKPLQKRTFSKFLGEICIAAGVERKYTPHCLRATVITYLNDHGFEARHIMFMSNHRNESSLRSYNRSLSSHQKKTLSNSLSSMASASLPSPSTTEVLPPPPVLKSPQLAQVNSPRDRGTLALLPTSTPTDMNLRQTDLNLTPTTPVPAQFTMNMQSIHPSAGFFSNANFSGCQFYFR